MTLGSEHRVHIGVHGNKWNFDHCLYGHDYHKPHYAHVRGEPEHEFPFLKLPEAKSINGQQL